ncbi:MAG: hypothetical protein LEGION0403_FIIPPAGN_02352 [Legionella sp.]|uniref:DUF2231 domain-containing protein n=1 Tax=Legionella fallonii LLAP-10 TaxID=1212491 RepID=A0A098GBA5_9GAMM|nr:DUF2231 domain-containing protein [Legionella fallonii]CEG59262.1 conserved membrane protein of unknown function [Legionella fallonii LLAP-10]
MFEILPNWHPILVHFTVALFTASFGFYLLTYLSKATHLVSDKITVEFEIVGRWCLWCAALVTILTVIAGLYAYNTVTHDEPAHIAMKNHRNWALSTAVAMWLVAIWSLWCYYKQKTITLTFLIGLLVVQGLLLSTAWRGGELVYRHGLGVLSLPSTGGETQHHHEESQ